MTLKGRVIRWLYCLFNIWQFTTPKISEKWLKKLPPTLI